MWRAGLAGGWEVEAGGVPGKAVVLLGDGAGAAPYEGRNYSLTRPYSLPYYNTQQSIMISAWLPNQEICRNIGLPIVMKQCGFEIFNPLNE